MQHDDDDLIRIARELTHVRAELAPLQEREAELATQLQRIAATAPMLAGGGRSLAERIVKRRYVGERSAANEVLFTLAEVGADWVGAKTLTEHVQDRRPELTNAAIGAAARRLGDRGEIEIDESDPRHYRYRRKRSGEVRRMPSQPPRRNGHSGANRVTRR